MPELPDVEVYRRYLEATALGRRIREVRVNDARILDAVTVEDLAARLGGNRFEATRRHGKHLLVRLARRGWLTLHFGMTGRLVFFARPEDDPPYDRVRFDFEEGHLAYVNRRMLGKVGLADDADAFIEAAGLGPDALDPAFDFAAFARALAGRRRDVKSALMDQSVIAGIGNIYADEILFHARLHPKARIERLDGAGLRPLFASMKDVLETAIACGAGSEQLVERLPDDYLLPRRGKGGRCPRCGHRLETLKSGGRTSWLCPTCQPAQP